VGFKAVCFDDFHAVRPAEVGVGVRSVRQADT
jgi:hypothetical protein